MTTAQSSRGVGARLSENFARLCMETTNHRVAGVEGGRIVNDGAVNNANVNKANVNEALGFEIFKHLTTLNAGSIVLIGTFLGDIFPHDKHGNLTIDQLT